MTAAATPPVLRRNTPQSLRLLLFLCWLVLVLQIWFASESDEFFDHPQHRHYNEGRLVGEDVMMDLPRRDDGFMESNFAQLGDGNFIETQKDGVKIAEETIDTLSAGVVQSDFPDDPNYTQAISTTMPNRNDTAYDCSIVWVRIPKTASTTIHKSFMRPLASWFKNTHISSNTCISHPGGCSRHWNTSSLDGNNQSAINFETACMEASNGQCVEYDNNTKTTNFGPSDKVPRILRNMLLEIGLGKGDLRRQFDEDDKFIKRVDDDENIGVFSPSVHAHVGLHTSLINTILPSKPMIFCAFREPKERLLSSFYYGIAYGADKPGHVQSCNLYKAGWTKGSWSERVATARRLATESNNTMKYQSLLRHYLETCKDATWNVYTQFLDPATKDVGVALHNLEKYVTVGLQNNITETLQLWANMTGRNCKNRPDYDRFRSTILSNPFNKTRTEEREKVSIAVKDSVVLVTPDFTRFDDDLKDMFHAYIKEDEIIYARAKELYAEQREMMLN